MIAHKDSEGNIKRTIDLSRPWKRARYEDLIRQVDDTWFERDHDDKLKHCKELGVEAHPGMQEFEITQQVFEKLVEEQTIDPLFVTHLPVELVPLAKQNVENPALVDVYELIINGQEISPGYSELNDPMVQRRSSRNRSVRKSRTSTKIFCSRWNMECRPQAGSGLVLIDW